MPRAPRDSDDDVDEKIATRRTRASAAANAPSTPVRRSTRGCNRPLSTIDSSPENDENVLKPVGRTTRSRAATLDKGSIPTVVKNLRSRKNSAASDLSESMDLDSVSKRVTRQNITATPTKTNPRARAVRAGSEVNSTPPTVVNKRVTRASSVEPSVNEPVVVTPRRRRTRASIIPPVHLSVHEEQEDDSNNLISEEKKSNQGSPDSHNSHNDSNKSSKFSEDVEQSQSNDADGVASSPEKMEPLNESKNKVKTPKKSPGSQKNLPKRKSNDHIESDEEMNDLFQDIPAEEWSNKISELNETTELSSENSIKGLKKDKQSSEANGVEESAEESDESEIESKSQKSLKLDQSNNDKKLFESPTKSPKSAGKNDEINISSGKLSSLNDSKSAKRKSLTGKSISEDKKVEIENNKSVEAMEIDEQSDHADSDNQMNTDSNSIEKNSQSLNKKKLNSLNKSFPIQNKNDSSKHNRCSLDSQKNSKNELMQVNFNKISEDLKFSKTNKNDISSKKSLNLSSIVDDDSSGSEISKVTYKNNLLNHISTDSPSKNIKDADEKETNKIRRSIELMKKKFPPKHDVSTIAQAGSSSDEEKNSESSDSEDDIKVDDKIDSDIEKEYNLAGKIITHYEDDDVPGDDCRASEEELSNSEDEGSDLQDFIVDDNDEEEDDSDSDYGNIIEIDEDEDDEDDEEVGMDKRAREKADKEESSDEMEEDEDSEDGEVDNKIDRENKKADDIEEKKNLSKSKYNNNANKSKSIIEAEPEIVDSNDDEEVEIETRKSISKNESANLSKSVNNKSINKSKSMIAEHSFNDSKSIKNKSLNISKSTNNKSVNKSKSIIEADPEIVDSNDDDDDDDDDDEEEDDDEEVEIETRKSISKNESANLSKSVNNKSINKSKSMIAEQSFNDSKSIKNKSLNISKSTNNKSVNKSKSIIEADPEIVDSNDDEDEDEEVEIVTRKSISKNESANLSKSVNNKSINKSKSMIADQSFNDSKSIKNKSLNLSKSTNNKSVNKSKSIIEADPEIVDSNDDDEDDEEVEIETRKSISKNESANLSKSVNNKSINKSKSMMAEQSFNDSKSIKNKSLNISKSLNDKSSLKPKIAIQESVEDDDDREDENEIITSDKNNSKLSKNKKMNNSIVDNKTKSLNPMILENSSSESSDSETENGEDSYRIITADQLDTSISKKKKILLESSTPKVLSTKKSLKNDKSLNDKKNLSAILDNSTTSKRKSGSLNDLTDSKAISKRQSLSEITAAMSNRENSKIFNNSITFNDTIEILDSSEGPLKNRQLWKLIPLNTTHQPVGSETPGTKFLKKSKLNESVPVLKSTEASPVGNKSKNDMKSKKNKIQESHDEEGDDSKLNKKSKKRKLQELSALELLENEDSIIKNSKKNKKRARTESSAEGVDDQPIENTCETKKKKKNKDKLLKTESFDSLEDIKSQNNPKTKKSKKDKEVPMDDSISSDQTEKKKKKKNKKQKESNYEEKILDDQPEDFYNELLKTKKKKLSSTSHSDENTSNDKIKLKEKKKSKSDETGDSMKKKSKSRVSDSDDEAPESVSFAEARSAAVEAAQRAIDRVKAQKQARQKKHKEHVNRMLEQKELKHTSGIKRLSEEFLEQLPNENMTRPVKRQKLSKGKERLVMSSTSMTSQEKPLSSAGSTTKFGVVALDRVNTVSKKSAAVISFREKMLARNSRQPISSHLAYLEKQRAKAELHK